MKNTIEKELKWTRTQVRTHTNIKSKKGLLELALMKKNTYALLD